MLLSASPRPFYGWPLLAGLSLAETVSWGVLYYSFTVFVRPIEAEMGWTRTQVTGAFSLALVASGLAAVPVGHWLDRHGARGLMTAGAIAGPALLVALAQVRSLAAFYAVWAGLGVAMAMVLYEPAFAVVSTWFVRRRDRALTILTLVAGLASTLVVPLASWLLASQGWRRAVLVLAVLLALVTIPIHALVLRRDPRAIGQWPDGDAEPPVAADAAPPARALGEVLGHARFWALAGAFTMASAVAVGVGVHLVPYLSERAWSPVGAGAALGAIGLMQLPGRAAFAPMRRGLEWQRAAAAVFAAQAGALVLLAARPTTASLLVFVALFGMGNGMLTLLRASTVADLYGTASYGRVSGVLALFGTLGRAAGPVAASLALGAWSSYGLVFALLAAGLVLAVALVLKA